MLILELPSFVPLFSNIWKTLTACISGTYQAISIGFLMMNVALKILKTIILKILYSESIQNLNIWGKIEKKRKKISACHLAALDIPWRGLTHVLSIHWLRPW